MINKHLRFLLSCVLGGIIAFSAHSASSIFSNYGQIQNVQNYSTNPFWTPSSPYNQRLPQPVYVQGADLNAEDCISVVQSLVSVQCMARDNCKDTSLAEIRPTIMVQLANLPGHNYASACAGYLDYIFESYVAQYGNKLPTRQVAFPTGTVPTPSTNTGPVIKNPYEIKTPKWQQEIQERTQELQELQEQNGAGTEHVSATAFPMTYEDLSFSDRMANAMEGYEPYFEKSAYVFPDDEHVLKSAEYCKSHPTDGACESYLAAQRVKKEVEMQKSDVDHEIITDDEEEEEEEETEEETEESEEEEQQQLTGTRKFCSPTKFFKLSESALTMFSKTEVQSPELAKLITEQYIKCSTTPSLKVPDSDFYEQINKDDYIKVVNDKNEIVYKVMFDDIFESNYKTRCKDALKAFCNIAGGVMDKTGTYCGNLRQEQVELLKDWAKQIKLGKNKSPTITTTETVVTLYCGG